LEVIYKVKQQDLSEQCSLGMKPTKGRKKGHSVDLLKPNLFETLGHERRHKYLSNHVCKGPTKHPLVLLLSSQKDNKIPPLIG